MMTPYDQARSAASGAAAQRDPRRVVLCDLDGVVWLANRPIPGSVEAIADLREAGHRVLFVTNNSSVVLAGQERALGDIGVPARGDVLTSAQAAALLVRPGERVLVCGGPGVAEALEERGAVIATGGAVDAVVVGFHRDFDYDGMARASAAVRRGARLIGTNDDATYPTPDGPIPGGGAILAAVATASGATPVVAGKPYAAMADLVAGVIGSAEATAALMVGDRPETDGRFAVTLGCDFALVRTGVTEPGAARPNGVVIDAADLAGVARAVIAAGSRRPTKDRG